MRAAAPPFVGAVEAGRPVAVMLSRERRGAPIYAFSPDERVCQRLALWWGVTPIHHPLAQDTEMPIAVMLASLLRRHDVAPGQTVVMVGAYPFAAGNHTNFVTYRVVQQDDPGAAWGPPSRRPLSIWPSSVSNWSWPLGWSRGCASSLASSVRGGHL